MATSTKALVGNKVYGGMTQTPNRGQVSARGAQGYMKRELNKNPIATPVGGDGRSDLRSNVASRALGRTKSMISGQGPATAPTGHQRPSNGPASTGPSGAPAGHQGPPVGAPAVSARPTVMVTEDGMLQLPYTNALNSAGYQALDESNQSILQLQTEQQNADRQYGMSMYELDIQQGDANRDILNRNASAGTAFSSQYVNHRTKSDRDINNERSNLISSKGMFDMQSEARRAAIKESFNNRLQAGVFDGASELAGQAGNLGLDGLDFSPKSTPKSNGWANVKIKGGVKKSKGTSGGGRNAAGKSLKSQVKNKKKGKK